MYINIVFFFLIALLYSSAGFGGGSLYLALLSSTGLEPERMVMIALFCNMVVTSIGTYHFVQSKEVHFARVVPLVLLSLPFSFWASTWDISNKVFYLTLASGLFLSGVLILVQSKQWIGWRLKNQKIIYLFVPFIGLIAGVTGIGGGVYLAPILYVAHWGKPKEIAGASAFFIFMNSVSGIVARWNTVEIVELSLSYWSLPAAVIAGGWIGSRISIKLLEQNGVRLITAGILLFAACRIFVKVA